MFNFKALVSIGAGVEMRFEKLSLPSNNATYTRPWFRANLGMTFPAPALKPFIGLEVSAPLVSENDFAQTAKSLAPKSQIGVYGGIRF